MKTINIYHQVIAISMVVLFGFLAGCGGGSSSNGTSFTIGGTIAGLNETGLVLQDNGGDNLVINSSGGFTFDTLIASGATYNVTIEAQPSGETCTVTNNSGTASSNVNNIKVDCVASGANGNTLTIGGTVTGLSGTGLVLQDNGIDDLTIDSSGDFTFDTPIASGTAYDVTVKAQPAGQTCGLTNSSGTASDNVSNVTVDCVASSSSGGTLTIGGTVTGLSGTGLVLQDNGTDDLTIDSSGDFTFNTPIASGTDYNVIVSTQPNGQTCGVINSNGTASDNVSNVTVDCVASSGGGGSLTLSAQDRTAVFNSIDGEIATLQDQSSDAFDQQLFQFMQTLPNLTNVKLRDGVISANFTDGPIVAIFDNLGYDPANSNYVLNAVLKPQTTAPTPIATTLTSQALKLTPRAANPAVATGEPHAKLAQVFYGLGPWYTYPSEGGPAAAPDVAKYLNTGKSYSGDASSVTQLDASVEALKSVSGDGVFYIHTHGGVIDLPPHSEPVITGGDKTAFMLWTTTERDENTEYSENSPIADDLFYGRLGYARARQNSTLFGTVPVEKWHYAITPEFIKYYGWTFAPNSLVFINTCYSASKGAASLKSAIKQAGASLYAGWTEEVDNGIANNTARFLIDRLIGANRYKPLTDKLRPYIMSDVIPAMKAANLGHSDTIKDKIRHIADLEITPMNTPDANEGGFGVLAPSIQNMFVDEQHHLLTLNGTFGDKPVDSSGKVTVGGLKLSIQSWNNNQIVCILPGDPTYIGETKVFAYGHESNAVPLTEIHGTLKVEQDTDETQQSGDSSYKIEHTVATSVLNLDIYFRVDVHWWRQHLSDDPKQSDPFPVYAAAYSKAHFTHIGSVYHDATQVATISGSGDLPLAYLPTDLRTVFNPVSGPVYYFEGMLDPSTGKLTAKFYFYGANGVVTKTGAPPAPWVFIGFPPVVSTPVAPADYLSNMSFSLDDHFNWLAGQSTKVKIPNQSAISGEVDQQLTWTESPATKGTLPKGHDEDNRIVVP